MTQDPNPKLLKWLGLAQAHRAQGRDEIAAVYDLLFQLEAFRPLDLDQQDPQDPEDVIRRAASALYREARSKHLDSLADEIVDYLGRVSLNS